MTSESFIPSTPLKTAVLFLIFNRPDTTKAVFEAIKQTKPPRLYIACDGARADKAGESEKVEQAREIALQVDWECEVKTLFRDQNLGCGKGVSSAITWFFEQEEQGIILEDDCLPSQSFFWYCEELLEKYKDDKRIMCVSGDNFQTQPASEHSYYFSRYNHCWGWASWRRAWSYYDFGMKDWESFRDNGGLDAIANGNKLFKIHWVNILNNARNVDTWDYQWTLTCWQQSGLTALPVVNLVSNIGFGVDSTHTANADDKSANMKAFEMKFPLIHPNQIYRNIKADDYTNEKILGITRINFLKSVIRRLVKSLINKI